MTLHQAEMLADTADAREHYAKLRDDGVCVRGRKHGTATHGVLCLRCASRNLKGSLKRAAQQRRTKTRRQYSAERRARNIAAKACINGALHGAATHGCRCERCAATHARTRRSVAA